MLWRLAEHYVAFRQPKSHKYRILAEAKSKGHAVQFDVIYYAESKLHSEIEEELGEAEGRYIRQYLPALNTQIPKEDNWRKYDYNAHTLTVTLEEILARDSDKKIINTPQKSSIENLRGETNYQFLS